MPGHVFFFEIFQELFAFVINYILNLQYIRSLYINYLNYKIMIPSDLIKGSLKTIVLKLLKEEGPMHGYAITRKVEELTEGKIKLTYGALYPILHKLEKEGSLVTATENFNNRIRIYYALTPKGHTVVADKIKELNEFIESLQRIVDTKPGLSHA